MGLSKSHQKEHVISLAEVLVDFYFILFYGGLATPAEMEVDMAYLLS
jgi:hypothetical protein